MVGLSKEGVNAVAFIMVPILLSRAGAQLNLENIHVTVMGLGRFGGGLGVSKWLLDQGANVLVTDLASEKELSSQLELLGAHPNLNFVFEEHRLQDFSEADLVVANPAVPRPWENTYLHRWWDFV